MYNQIASNKRKSVLLIFIFIIILVGVGYAYDWFYGSAQTPYVGIIMALVISLLMTSISYFAGDKIALFASGAKKISKEDNRYIYNLVENLCIAAGLSVPKIYIIDDPAINAFATGRKPALSSIAVTRGAIEKLGNEELEGVIAHELSHVKNFDIRFMMLVAVLVGAIAILANMFYRVGFISGRDNDNNNRGGGILALVGLIFIIVSPIVAELIKLAISRKREFLADASAALLTRYPEGLARALEKIGAENRPLKRASGATAHLFIANPFGRGRVMSLFSTHPPLAERIKRLREMAR
ncbi:M48 family metallopeptidase [Candidatus Falkowbacteria bacterium]|nr:M48 family metallopeptidase [Candidatus Falkowbacteria bacterium]